MVGAPHNSGMSSSERNETSGGRGQGRGYYRGWGRGVLPSTALDRSLSRVKRTARGTNLGRTCKADVNVRSPMAPEVDFRARSSPILVSIPRAQPPTPLQMDPFATWNGLLVRAAKQPATAANVGKLALGFFSTPGIREFSTPGSPPFSR